MKKFLVIFGLLLASVGHAYVSNQGIQPDATQGTWEYEYKSARKSNVPSWDAAIVAGQALYYDVQNYAKGAYTVSPYQDIAGNDAASAALISCIAGRAVATGDYSFFPCITRGYVDKVPYDATGGILVGGSLCVGTQASTVGRVIPCSSGVTSGIRALRANSSGTGSDMPVILDRR